MKKIYALLSAVLFTSIVIYGQSSKEKYGDQYFYTLGYSKAAEIYNEIISEKKQKEKLSASLYRKAALSSYFSKDYERSFNYFAYLNKIDSLLDQEVPKLIDCGLRLNKYDQLKIFGKARPELVDGYNQNINEFINEINMILDDSSAYTISKWPQNSGFGDYCAVQHNNQVYFSSNRPIKGQLNEYYEWDNSLYSSLLTESGGAITYVDNCNSKLHDGPISFDKINNEIYLTRNRKKNESGREFLYIVIGSYNEEGIVQWQEFDYNSNNFNVGHATISSSGNEIIFSSDDPKGYGGSDLYICKRMPDGKWGLPENLGAYINTYGDELFPWLSENNELYFSTNGTYGFGGLDIYLKSSLKDQNYPINLGNGINSNQDDFGFNYSDIDSGFFSSDREKEIDAIYQFKALEVKGYLVLSLRDRIRRKTIESAEVALIDLTSGDTIREKVTAGKVVFNLDRNKDYLVVGDLKNHELDAPILINTDALRNNEKIEKYLDFNKVSYDLKVISIVKESKKRCPQVKVGFTDEVSGERINIITDSLGVAYVNLEIGNKYEVNGEKAGFLPINTRIIADDTVLVELGLELEVIKKDAVFALENIFYDLDKATLRDSSKYELNKLVDFLKLNSEISIELGSHTDSRGSSSYNLKLSQRRAESCVLYLISKGINSNRIKAKGYGESKLVNECADGVKCSEDKHQENRRTEVKILSK